ncbi:unnamed protein product [Arabis nemorensis]|uniref:Uncharacterized protein n=1 Tax=Arabis nemorensis TaxID=586526 RepID=A0A565CDN5_9BRAS|nr:unnamed protein product [Arabis nemorensis]
MKVAKLFCLCPKRQKPSLSFWHESEETVLSQMRMPPVTIDSESALQKFKYLKKEKPGINLYMSLSNVEDEEMDVPLKGIQNNKEDRNSVCPQELDDKTVIRAVEDALVCHTTVKDGTIA